MRKIPLIKIFNVMLGLLMNLEFGALIDPELGLVLNLLCILQIFAHAHI